MVLYFYCCDVRIQEQLVATTDGVYACNKKIENPEEFKEVRRRLAEETIEKILKQQPCMRIAGMQVTFTAFNPL